MWNFQLKENRCASSFMAHLEARKVKNLNSIICRINSVLVCMKNVFIDPNLRPFPKIPHQVIMVGTMPTLTKNLSFDTGTGHLLERERKLLKKGPEKFLPGPQDPLTGPVYKQNFCMFEVS